MVGDNLILVHDRVRALGTGAPAINLTPDVLNFMLDARTLLLDFEYFVHDVHRGVVTFFTTNLPTAADSRCVCAQALIRMLEY